MRPRDFIVLCSLLAAACTKPSTPKDAGPAAAATPASISVVAPQPKDVIRRVIEQPGRVHPDEETQLIAKLPGFVAKVHADIGQLVKGPRLNDQGKEIEPGQLLAEISVPETEEEAKQKQALVRQAEAEVDQARKAVIAADAHIASADSLVEEAKAGLAKAQALYDRWQSESKRVAGLVTGGVVDAQTRDETTNQFKAAEAGRAEAKARIVSAEAAVRKAVADRGKADADVKAAEARVEVCQADARRLAAILSYAKIRAPFDGVVTSRNVNTGDLLNATGNRQAIFTVARLNPVRVVIHVAEADAGLVTEKLTANLAVTAAQTPKLAGKVARTSWSLEPGSRTLRVEIDVPNPDGGLRPGMYVNASIPIDIPVAWTVPASAVGKQGDATFCFLVHDGKAVKTTVQVGRSDGQHTELLSLKRESAAPEWVAVTGSERVAVPAAALLHGQAIAPAEKSP